VGATKAALTGVTVFGLILAGTLAIGSAAATCGTETVNLADASKAQPVAGYAGQQLVIAGAIINAATSLGLGPDAATIAVMTGMGESSLRNLAHGDAVDPTTIGVFQQGESYGPRADRMNPDKAARAFLTRLAQVPGWQQMPPSHTAHAVQINQDPEHYTRFYPAAVEVVQALSGSAPDAACSAGAVSHDSRALAQELLGAVTEGRLRVLESRYLAQIRDVAEGHLVPDCGIDVGVLQLLVLTVRSFHTVGVSDLNRKCTKSRLGAGEQSSHWIAGGGKAVDIYALNGRTLTGADSHSIRLIAMLDPLMPDGARVGQAQCRRSAGTTLALQHFTQFDDTCNHLHIDLAYATNPRLRAN
jgi:hypothetical protein